MATRGERSGSGLFLRITLLFTYKQTLIWTASALTTTVTSYLTILIWQNVHDCTPVPIILFLQHQTISLFAIPDQCLKLQTHALYRK